MANESVKSNSDKDTLEQLNKEYVETYLSADVAWYEKHLADDFVCIESDGSLGLDRKGRTAIEWGYESHALTT